MTEHIPTENPIELTGKVTAVTYHNEVSGWTVLTMDCQGDSVRAVGIMPKPNVGEILVVKGEYVEHPTYGTQFYAETSERHLPERAEDILDYLMSGAIKGIGRVTATEIIRKFGDDALNILQNDPLRLAEIKNISLAKARQLGEEFRKQFGMREAILACTDFGLQPVEAMRCWRRWGQKVVDRLQASPYDFCDPELMIGFDRIDDICLRRGTDREDEQRVRAGIRHVLVHNLNNGHTCLPQDKLIPTAAAMLEITLELCAAVLERMLAEYSLERSRLRGKDFLFLPELYEAEKHIANEIAFRADMSVFQSDSCEDRIRSIENLNGIEYAPEQRRAIETALNRGLLILTGGPGTGKTTTLRAVLMLLEADGEEVALAAPTGRAAQRLSEMTGCEAKTIHRLLKVQWAGDTQEFFYNAQNPLDATTVIVDELSMVDVLLFDHLLSALKPNCRLIMVGDTDQLPAVGPGNILGDLIESGKVPVVQLKQVFRQAMESEIVTNAHRIVAGEFPKWSNRNGDCFLLRKGNYTAVTETVIDLCCRRLPDSYGKSVHSDIQILCPGRKGEIGTIEINKKLQMQLNPPRPDVRCVQLQGGYKTLRVGDKVMQMRNNYDLSWSREDGSIGSGIFNGEIGLLVEILPHERVLTVDFDGRLVSYTYQEAEDLELAYAITIHKSQGSEFDIVILPLYRPQPKLAYRNLLYTAVTRAKTLLIIVGTEEAISQMLENVRKTKRYTALQSFLTEGSEQA